MKEHPAKSASISARAAEENRGGLETNSSG